MLDINQINDEIRIIWETQFTHVEDNITRPTTIDEFYNIFAIPKDYDRFNAITICRNPANPILLNQPKPIEFSYYRLPFKETVFKVVIKTELVPEEHEERMSFFKNIVSGALKEFTSFAFLDLDKEKFGTTLTLKMPGFDNSYCRFGQIEKENGMIIDNKELIEIRLYSDCTLLSEIELNKYEISEDKYKELITQPQGE